jgi:hypothetical protein
MLFFKDIRRGRLVLYLLEVWVDMADIFEIKDKRSRRRGGSKVPSVRFYPEVSSFVVIVKRLVFDIQPDDELVGILKLTAQAEPVYMEVFRYVGQLEGLVYIPVSEPRGLQHNFRAGFFKRHCPYIEKVRIESAGIRGSPISVRRKEAHSEGLKVPLGFLYCKGPDYIAGQK